MTFFDKKTVFVKWVQATIAHRSTFDSTSGATRIRSQGWHSNWTFPPYPSLSPMARVGAYTQCWSHSRPGYHQVWRSSHQLVCYFFAVHSLDSREIVNKHALSYVLVQVTTNAPETRGGEACTSDRKNGNPDSDTCVCECSLRLGQCQK